MIALLVIVAVVVSLPLAAVVLVTIASLREDSAHSLAGQPTGTMQAAARRLLGFHGDGAELWPGGEPRGRGRPGNTGNGGSPGDGGFRGDGGFQGSSGFFGDDGSWGDGGFFGDDGPQGDGGLQGGPPAGRPEVPHLVGRR